MTELTLTAQQIAERIRQEDLSGADYQSLARAITARRSVLKLRLASIENHGSDHRAAMASGDPGQFAALNREAETIDDELGILCDLETRVYRLHAAAREREDIEAAHKARKQLPGLTERASAALSAYMEARRALSDAVDSIGATQRIEKSFLTAETFEQVAAAMFPLMTGDALRGARHALRGRICAPAPPTYGSVEPDYAAQIRDAMASPFGRRGS